MGRSVTQIPAKSVKSREVAFVLVALLTLIIQPLSGVFVANNASALDDTPPSISMTAPEDGVVFTDTNEKVAVNIRMQDDVGVKRYHFDVDGVLPPSYAADIPGDTDMLVATPVLQVNASFALSDLTEDKPYTVTVIATDTAGATTTMTRQIYVDRAAPVITTGIQDGQQVSGALNIDATTGEKNPTSYHIAILDGAETIVAEQASDGNMTGSFVWNWDSSSVANGTYTIQYAVTDKAGRQTTLTRDVQITNEPVRPPDPPAPTVTIAGIYKRTISGTVSDPAASFAMTLDGVARTDMKVVLGDQNTDGTYTWTLLLPSDVTAGVEHTLAVTANVNGKQSEVATFSFTLPYIPPVTGVSGDAPVDPLLEQLSTTLTQPFSIPESFGDIPTPVKVPEVDMKSAEAAVLQKVKDPSPDQNVKAPVAATSSGWKILGLYWYVWMFIAGGAVVLTLFVRAWMRRRKLAALEPDALSNLAE